MTYKGIFNILVLLFCGHLLLAQHYTTQFGQNRIQYKNFDWKYYSTNKFEVFYYKGGKQYAQQTLDILSEEYDKITDQLGYAPYSKIKIFIYNSIYDLQQSNIGIEGATYTIGGQTEFVKLDVEIAHPGKAKDFRQLIIYQITSKLIDDMMYGGSLASVFQNSYLLSLPNWFIDGAAKYLAYGWSKDMDDFVREQMKEKRIKKLSRFRGEEATLIGQSIWNFIAVKYGERNIANILNLTRIIRKEDKSIMNTLGVSFNSFINEWQKFYSTQENEIIKKHTSPAKNLKITSLRGQNQLITSSIKFNQNGDKIAYATAKNGKYNIYVKNLTSGKIKKVGKGGYQISGQENDKVLPLLDWKDQDNLGSIVYKRGSLYLNLYNTVTNKRSQKSLTRFKKVNSFSFNDNGKLVVLSGDIDGKNEIFLTTMKRASIRRITKDGYDDTDPVFIPGTAAIIFSSNRKTNKLRPREKPSFDEPSQYDLFLYDLDTTKHSFHRLTHTDGNESSPYIKNGEQMFYLSDVNGITNLYRYSFRNKTSDQVTKYKKSILSYDLHFDPDRISFLMLDGKRNQAFLDKSPSLYANNFTAPTPRKNHERSKFLIRKKLEKATPATIPKKEKPDIVKVAPKKDTIPQDNKVIDTDNYEFEDEAEEETTVDSFFSKYKNFKEKEQTLGPLTYTPRFSFNNTITSFLWDPYRDFMIFMETEINDLRENYKVKGGALTTFNFKEGDLFVEFQYLKNWLDFKFRYDKKTYTIVPNKRDLTIYQKYKLNKLAFTAALPITHMFRMEVSPTFHQVSFLNLNPQFITSSTPNQADDQTDYYFGGAFSLIYDNSVKKEFNRYEGTRAMLKYQTNLNIDNSSKSFGNIKLDIRHYQKIHKEIIWANRLVYGRQTGISKKKYMLGGVNNWVFAKSEAQGEEDPLIFKPEKPNSDIFFNEFVTNLRGLKYNEAFGSNVLLLNSEIRFPIFEYLSNTPIKSNFLRNFQVTGFVDVGSVWDGPPPFKKGRPIVKTFKNKNAFSAKIVKYQFPWLAGYGFGLRSVLFGYYVKFDWAIPYTDFESGDRRLYLGIGLDF